ncbi:hypothetical protein D3C73_1021910 [compost metagenome]
MACRVGRGVDDADEVGIANRHGKARVLGQVEITRRRQRRDDTQRLRQDDQTHDLAVVQSQRPCRFPLPPIDGLDACTNDFGDDGREFYDEAG